MCLCFTHGCRPPAVTSILWTDDVERDAQTQASTHMFLVRAEVTYHQLSKEFSV